MLTKASNYTFLSFFSQTQLLGWNGFLYLHVFTLNSPNLGFLKIKSSLFTIDDRLNKASRKNDISSFLYLRFK